MYKIINFLSHFIDKKQDKVSLFYINNNFLSILELFSIGLVIPIIGLITNENFSKLQKSRSFFFIFLSS